MFGQIDAKIKIQALDDSLQKRAGKGRLAMAQGSRSKSGERSKASRGSRSLLRLGRLVRAN